MSQRKERFLWVASLIKDAEQDNRYGEIVIKFEKGNIVHVEEKEVKRPPKRKMSSN